MRFMVLCPGPLEGLQASRNVLRPAIDGEDVAFICDADLSIARAVRAEMGFGQIIPGFLEIKPNLTVPGRSLAGDQATLEMRRY